MTLGQKSLYLFFIVLLIASLVFSIHTVGKERDYTDSSIDKFNALGVPFVYVVDQSGEIVFDFVESNYKVRISADDLLAAAENARD